jgi:3-methylcrotonyl-CoA carboxylase alpha subunit
LIGRDIAALTAVSPMTPQTLAFAAIIAAGLADPTGPLTGFALWTPLARRIDLRVGDMDRMTTLRITGPDDMTVTLDDRVISARRGPDGWRLDGQAAPAWVRHGDRITLFGAATHLVCVPDPLERTIAAGLAGDTVLAPMPGLVRSVNVAVGDAVKAGDRLAVLEAMKMEHVLRAPRDGVVAEVRCVAGGQVAAKAVLILLVEEGSAAPQPAASLRDISGQKKGQGDA